MYYRGLKDNVKDELMRYSAWQDTLDRLIRAYIEIDNKLYKRQVKKRYTRQDRRRTSYVNNGWTGGQRRRDPNAIEINATFKGPREGRRFRAKGKGKP